MNVNNEKQTDDGDELQKARDLYKKIKRITERGRDVRVKRKKDGKKVWWKCKKCGHEWQAVVRYRAISGREYPFCSNTKKRSKTDGNS